jgi:hypothetical protein
LKFLQDRYDEIFPTLDQHNLIIRIADLPSGKVQIYNQIMEAVTRHLSFHQIYLPCPLPGSTQGPGIYILKPHRTQNSPFVYRFDLEGGEWVEREWSQAGFRKRTNARFYDSTYHGPKDDAPQVIFAGVQSDLENSAGQLTL